MHPVYNGQDSMQYSGQLIWNMILDYVKDFETLDIFKDKVQKWSSIGQKAHQFLALPLHKIYTKPRLDQSDLI